jgi:hypothetical protein
MTENKFYEIMWLSGTGKPALEIIAHGIQSANYKACGKEKPFA